MATTELWTNYIMPTCGVLLLAQCVYFLSIPESQTSRRCRQQCHYYDGTPVDDRSPVPIPVRYRLRQKPIQQDPWRLSGSPSAPDAHDSSDRESNSSPTSPGRAEASANVFAYFWGLWSMVSSGSASSPGISASESPTDFEAGELLGGADVRLGEAVGEEVESKGWVLEGLVQNQSERDDDREQQGQEEASGEESAEGRDGDNDDDDGRREPAQDSEGIQTGQPAVAHRDGVNEDDSDDEDDPSLLARGRRRADHRTDEELPVQLFYYWYHQR